MDRWSASGKSILAPEQLEAVRRFIETTGSIAVMHWHYRGSRAPKPMAFDSFEAFETFLRTNTAHGDAIDVWPFPEQQASRIADGKVPNERGETPEGGAY